MEKKSTYILIGMGMLFSGFLILFYTMMPSSVIMQSPTETSVSAVADVAKANAISNTSTTTEVAAIYPINLNTATAKDLSDNISGIGDVLAARIIEYREQNGPFSSVDDLINISGIGEKKLSAMRDYVTVN